MIFLILCFCWLMSFGPLEAMNGHEFELDKELWHANAGPNIHIPQVGDLIVYFAQGNMEQVKACTSQDGNSDTALPFKLPSKILCKVINVHLKAESKTDEVSVRMTLLPESNQELLESDYVNNQTSPVPSRHAKIFTKILTSSDTSGFTVPKRLAEEAFPALNMSLDPPFQDLVATDIHGNEWKFCHIYRGNPKRHLITSGWHTYVITKKIIAGDICIFLREPSGKLRIGIRRASSLKDNSTTFVISSHDMQLGLLASARNALLCGTPFSVYYHPWTSPAGFIISYDKYMKSVKFQCAIGTRFTATFEGDDTKRMRPIGKVAAIDDLDSEQWPDSEWRRLKIDWEGVSDKLFRPTRISVWNIESIEPRRRRNITTMPPRKRPIRPGLAQSNFSLSRFQSQENRCMAAFGSTGSWPSSDPFPGHPQVGISDQPEFRSQASAYQLQGESSNLLSQMPHELEDHIEPHEQDGYKEANNLVAKQKELDKQPMVFGFNLASTFSEFPSKQPMTSDELPHCRRFTPITSLATSDANNGPERCLCVSNNHCNKCCCLFLPSLAKVRKEGSDASIAIDLTRFSSYEELIFELDKMFEFEGKLIDGSAEWKIKYIDHDDELMHLVGDHYPWQTFKMVVKRLLVCTNQNIARLPTQPC